MYDTNNDMNKLLSDTAPCDIFNYLDTLKLVNVILSITLILRRNYGCMTTTLSSISNLVTTYERPYTSILYHADSWI